MHEIQSTIVSEVRRTHRRVSARARWLQVGAFLGVGSTALFTGCGAAPADSTTFDEPPEAASALAANDCRVGKGCTTPSVTFDITPQVPSEFGDVDYCKDRTCKKGEGDCDSDAECATGLKCVFDRGAFVGLDPTVDICWPSDSVCTNLGPCAENEGDCDQAPGTQGPRQCAEGLVCTNLTGETDECRPRTPDDLGATLAGFSVNAPGFAAAVFDRDGTVAIGVRGVRKSGSTTKLSKTDRFHLGSDTKAMTSALAAVLVEKTEITWTYRDTWHTKHSGWTTNPTLFAMLGHRTGFAANPSVALTGTSLTSHREQIAKEAFRLPPHHAPGSYEYGNQNYMIAAHLIERKLGTSYESLMQTHLFAPLGMSSCGWGPSPNVSGHTKGTTVRDDGVSVYGFIPNNGDNPGYYNSAGRAHCSLDDWGKFLREYLRGAVDRSALLPQERYEEMQVDPGAAFGNYQAGWILTRWDGELALSHDGSNTLNYATAWVVPARGVAVVVVANSAVSDLFGNPGAQVRAIAMDLLATYGS